MKNTAHSKKMLYDWLDRTRPWNKHKNAYDLMEAIVNQAALYFNDARTYTENEINDKEALILKLTENLSEHPEDYDGPCLCDDCKSCG